MWDFSIGRSVSIMMRTWPFIVFRMIVYFGITVAYIMATGTGASVGYGVGHISADPDGPMSFALWGGVVGFGVVSRVGTPFFSKCARAALASAACSAK